MRPKAWPPSCRSDLRGSARGFRATGRPCRNREQLGKRYAQIVQVGLQRVGLVDRPVEDAAGQCANDDVGQRFRVVTGVDLSAGDAFFDEFDEGVVQVESAVDRSE